MKKYKLLDIFIIFLLVLNILPIVAPILAHWDLAFLSEPIYFLYSFTCHQFHWRSLHIHDHQFAWCARDMFIWGSTLLSAFAVKKGWLNQKIALYWMIPFTIPIALDGGIQTISTVLGLNPNSNHIYLSTNLMRMVTGSIFGLGLGAVFGQIINDYDGLKAQITDKFDILKSQTSKFVFLFSTLFIIYLGLIQLWRTTSPLYPPAGLTDHIIRPGPPVEEWVDSRGEHS